jgi:hypothetical protein
LYELAWKADAELFAGHILHESLLLLLVLLLVLHVVRGLLLLDVLHWGLLVLYALLWLAMCRVG